MKIRFFKQDLINKPYANQLKNAIDDLILGNSSIVQGKYSLKFEEAYSLYVGSKYCVYLSNGLEALSLALQSIGVGEGDEVIVPNHTYIASWLSILNVGAKVIAAPVKTSNLLIDEEKIERYITNKTKAIMPVHLYGNIANMKDIRKIASKNNIYVVDDAAQAHGSGKEGEKVGNLADISCFSFYPTKNLGSLGEAGCITTNNLDIANKIKSLRNYGRSSRDPSENIYLGGNYRGDELQAAFLISKLENLEFIKKQRKNIISIYKKNSELKKNTFWKLIEYCEHSSPHLAVVKLKNLEIRDKLLNYLSLNSIQTAIHYKVPCHRQKFLKKNQFFINEEDASQAENIADTIISVPMSEVHTFEEINYVINSINEFFILEKY